MFKRMTMAWAAVLAIALGASGAAAQSLKVGDPAPPLALGKFVKGEPVKEFESGKVYVIECWATWCGPCIAAIPHVTKLQQQYKDQGVVVIGVDVWENDPAAVDAFVKKMGDKMDYRVALDDVPAGQKEGKTATTWLRAAGRNGIPCSFVVDQKGRIAWVGHPMSGLDKVVAQVVKGEYDPQKAAASEAKAQQLQQQIQESLRAENWDAGLKALEELATVEPAMAEQIDFMRFNVLARGKKDMDAAYKLASELGEKHKDHAQILNQLSWTILDAPGMEPRNHDVALKLAEQAAKASSYEEAAVLDTLARAHFDKGDKAKAVEWQKKAVAAEDNDERKAQMQQTLEKYMAGLFGC